MYEESIKKYIPTCVVGGLATILLSTNIIGFVEMKKILNKYDAQGCTSQEAVKYVREFMKYNEPENKIIKIIRKTVIGLGEELAYITHK